jgi:hypothetical protein
MQKLKTLYKITVGTSQLHCRSCTQYGIPSLSILIQQERINGYGQDIIQARSTFILHGTCSGIKNQLIACIIYCGSKAIFLDMPSSYG